MGGRSAGKGAQAYEKHAITLPPDLAEAAREQVRARGLSSFSAYIAEAVRRDLESRRFDELLDAIFAEQPMTDEEREWAENALYGEQELHLGGGT